MSGGTREARWLFKSYTRMTVARPGRKGPEKAEGGTAQPEEGAGHRNP